MICGHLTSTISTSVARGCAKHAADGRLAKVKPANKINFNPGVQCSPKLAFFVFDTVEDANVPIFKNSESQVSAAFEWMIGISLCAPVSRAAPSWPHSKMSDPFGGLVDSAMGYGQRAGDWLANCFSPCQAAILIYLTLFVSAFLSATLLPGSSEAALAGAVALSGESVALLVATATVGNTLGSCVNWLLGLLVNTGGRHVKLPVSAAQLSRFEHVYRRYGVWSLLLSWAPIIGDPLTVLAGLARTPLAAFVPLVAIGKLARYLIVVGIVSLW